MGIRGSSERASERASDFPPAPWTSAATTASARDKLHPPNPYFLGCLTPPRDRGVWSRAKWRSFSRLMRKADGGVGSCGDEEIPSGPSVPFDKTPRSRRMKPGDVTFFFSSSEKNIWRVESRGHEEIPSAFSLRFHFCCFSWESNHDVTPGRTCGARCALCPRCTLARRHFGSSCDQAAAGRLLERRLGR